MSTDPLSPPPDTSVIEHSLGTAWLARDGIVRVVWRAGVVIDLAAAEDATTCNGKLATGRAKRPVIIDVRSIRSVTSEARAHFAGPIPAEIQSAVALVVKSRVSRMIANFFLGINKSKTPLRLFTDAELALEWLERFTK